MSRQSKQVQRAKLARQFSAARKAGNKGPAQTVPKHGKKPANRSPQNRVRRVVAPSTKTA